MGGLVEIEEFENIIVATAEDGERSVSVMWRELSSALTCTTLIRKLNGTSATALRFTRFLVRI